MEVLMSEYDINGLYQFLAHTPEQGLRKILIDQMVFTEFHFNLLLKIVRGCDENTFCKHLENNDFPKLKYNPNETKIKEKFWNDLITVCKTRGLLNPAQKIAA